MEVTPTGLFVIDECEIRTDRCTAGEAAPVTPVWAGPRRTQINVCRACLEEMVRTGEWQVKGARVTPRVDLGVIDSQDRIRLAVEVKGLPLFGRPDTDRLATTMYRNLVVHGALFPSDYFMLALYPEPFYLWINSGRDPNRTVPDYRFSVATELTTPEGLEDMPLSDARVAEVSVAQWLRDLISSGSGHTSDGPDWLVGSGLSRALEDGRIVKEPMIRMTALL